MQMELHHGLLDRAMPLRLVPPIHRATHRIGLYLAGLRDDALSQGEAHILALLATSGPSTIAELHRGLAHKRSTLTSILDRLAERGFVTRAVGAADRRTFVVTPTAKGRRVATRVHRHLTDLERAAASRVSSDDIRGFMKVLAAVEDEAHRRTAHPRKSQVASLKSHSLKSRR
jgi:DNA-binding MarR family transcriptional regulator